MREGKKVITSKINKNGKFYKETKKLSEEK
jgi:hypothetical protein